MRLLVLSFDLIFTIFCRLYYSLCSHFVCRMRKFQRRRKSDLTMFLLSGRLRMILHMQHGCRPKVCIPVTHCTVHIWRFLLAAHLWAATGYHYFTDTCLILRMFLLAAFRHCSVISVYPYHNLQHFWLFLFGGRGGQWRVETNLKENNEMTLQWYNAIVLKDSTWLEYFACVFLSVLAVTT